MQKDGTSQGTADELRLLSGKRRAPRRRRSVQVRCIGPAGRWFAGRTVDVSRGGLPKRAIPEAELTLLSIAGDLCAHPQFHGGPRQALLLISAEGIDELAALGFPLFHGALGENITTRGLDRRMWRVGQRWRIGPAAFCS